MDIRIINANGFVTIEVNGKIVADGNTHNGLQSPLQWNVRTGGTDAEASHSLRAWCANLFISAENINIRVK